MEFKERISLEPPFTDRGVENTLPHPANTKKRDVEMVFDWFQCTIQGYDVDYVLTNLFHCTRDICLHTPSGRFGYNNTLTYGANIILMWSDRRLEMGVHVLLSGTACRALEELMSWSTFLERIYKHENVSVTRVDVAIDCFDKYFDVNELREYVLDGCLVSKFKQTTYIEQLQVQDGSQQSASLKFGSMSSDIYIVFYDKLAERKNAGYTISDDITFWTRCEIRFKHELANRIIALFISENYQLGTYVNQILYNYLDFKDIGHDSNKSRWQTSAFWTRFLGIVDKLSIAPKSQQTTIERKQKWATMTFSKVALMLSVVDNNFYKNLIEVGHEKISKTDLDIINAHFISQGIPTMDMDDINAIYKRLLSQKFASLSDAVRYEQTKMHGV